MPVAVGSKGRGKRATGVIVKQMHCRIVDKRSLVYVEIQRLFVPGLHHERRLHGPLVKCRGRHIAHKSCGMARGDFTQLRACVLILLSIVVAWYPPGCMVACHGEPAKLLVNDKQLGLLLGKYVAESKTLVKHTELHIEKHIDTVGLLFHLHYELTVVVDHRILLAPHRRPGLVMFRLMMCGHLESGGKCPEFLHLKSQIRGGHNLLPVKRSAVSGRPTLLDIEVYKKFSIGRTHL